MNRMADVAALFGKKLGESFVVDYEGETLECRFAETGFKACILGDELMNDDEVILQCLILGKAVIVDE